MLRAPNPHLEATHTLKKRPEMHLINPHTGEVEFISIGSFLDKLFDIATRDTESLPDPSDQQAIHACLAQAIGPLAIAQARAEFDDWNRLAPPVFD